jgi:hypothetical protein
MALGRKLLPAENPVTAAQRFAWLVRAIRSSSPDQDIVNTESFALKLNGYLSEHLQPATINRLETGTVSFSIERCQAYELALGLPYCELIDAYIWIFRQRGSEPKTIWSTIKEATAAEIELLVRLAREEPLKPLEWLHLAYLYRNRPELITDSKRLKDLFLDGIIRDMGRYYERDQRIMREALITVGKDIVSPVVEAVTQEPIRFFNAPEALGFIPGQHAWQALVKLHRTVPDRWAAPGILESIMRKLDADSRSGLTDEHLIAALKESSVKALEQTDMLFIARESSLAVVRRINSSLTANEARRLNSLRPDLMQLEIKPSSVTRREVLDDISKRFGRAVTRSDFSMQIPSHMPGLTRIVHDALFAGDRCERVLNGVLLTPWKGSYALTDAVGGSLQHIPKSDYGTQRSMVRFATKLGTSNLNSYLRELASSRNLETNTNVSIAWALGAGSEPADEEVLKKLYGSAASIEEKRAVCTAAMRRGFAGLIRAISRDHDGTVAREAMIALSILDPNC